MKVLNIVKTNRGAGWAYRQVEWAVQNCKDIEFSVVMPKDEGGYADLYKQLGCKVIACDFSLPVKKPWLFEKRKKSIREIVSKEKPDIIHSHFVTTTYMLRLSLGKDPTKRIFQVPGPLHLENAVFRTLDKLTSNKHDYWVGSCKWTVGKYKEIGIPDDHLFLNYYGVAISPLYSGNKLRSDLKIADNNQIVGMVSFFYKPKYYLFQFRGIKGHEDFIQAVKIVREKYPNVVGVVVGNAWEGAEKYEQKVHEYAKKICKDGIIFAGYRNDVREIYHEMSIAVHPSMSENLGGAGQSLSQCVPTISTNVGGFPDIVIDGITGWTVNKKSPKQIADRIIWMLENETKAKQMAESGRHLYEQMLSIEVTGKKMVDIYRDVLSR